MIPDIYITLLSRLLPQLEAKLAPPEPGCEKKQLSHGLSESEMIRQASLLMEKLEHHYPFHHPLYTGQMLKPPHPVAWFAYAMAMSINPNNHALDGGPGASILEKEVIQQLKHFVGYKDDALGHLTSSGTIANLEALWIARELHPDKPVAVCSNAHYTHRRMCRLLRHPVMDVPEDADGLPDLSWLEAMDELPGTMVVTLGTTGLGTVQPLHFLCDWAEKRGVRIHVDAAYGGFYHLLADTGWIAPEPWKALHRADSMVIDPHKHGLQPYGCGCVLFKDSSVGRFYKHDSPYTYFTSDDLHLGEISMECSRAGASAVALWLTLQCFPLEKIPAHHLNNGSGIDSSIMEKQYRSVADSGTSYRFASMLADCRLAALKLYEILLGSPFFQPVMEPHLDIVTFIPLTDERTYSSVSRKVQKILKDGMNDVQHRLYVSILKLDHSQASHYFPELTADQDGLDVLRMVLMKPDHTLCVEEMAARLEWLAKN